MIILSHVSYFLKGYIIKIVLFFLVGASQKVSGSTFEALGAPQKVSGSAFEALGAPQKVSGSTFEVLGTSRKVFSLAAGVALLLSTHDDVDNLLYVRAVDSSVLVHVTLDARSAATYLNILRRNVRVFVAVLLSIDADGVLVGE